MFVVKGFIPRSTVAADVFELDIDHSEKQTAGRAASACMPEPRPLR